MTDRKIKVLVAEDSTVTRLFLVHLLESDPQIRVIGAVGDGQAACGANNVLRKPYDERQLLSRIDYLLMNMELRRRQKMGSGVEITLDGRTHFITSDRQQILDLLISTFEQAVQVREQDHGGQCPLLRDRDS